MLYPSLFLWSVLICLFYTLRFPLSTPRLFSFPLIVLHLLPLLNFFYFSVLRQLPISNVEPTNKKSINLLFLAAVFASCFSVLQTRSCGCLFRWVSFFCFFVFFLGGWWWLLIMRRINFFINYELRDY